MHRQIHPCVCGQRLGFNVPPPAPPACLQTWSRSGRASDTSRSWRGKRQSVTARRASFRAWFLYFGQRRRCCVWLLLSLWVLLVRSGAERAPTVRMEDSRQWVCVRVTAEPCGPAAATSTGAKLHFSPRTQPKQLKLSSVDPQTRDVITSCRRTCLTWVCVPCNHKQLQCSCFDKQLPRK